MQIEKFMEWQQIIDDIKTDDKNKYDIECVEADRMTMNDSSGLVRIAGQKDNFVLTPWSSKQVCRFFKIPFEFWNNVLDNEARAYLFNKFSHDNSSQFYVRCRESNDGAHTIRGILSDKFMPLDNRFVLEQLKEFMQRNDQYKIVNFNLNDLSMEMRMVLNSDGINVGNGNPDYLYGGIHLGNSEIGLKSTMVDSMIFRLICANGAIMRAEGQSFLNQNHRGFPETDFAEEYQDAIWEAVAFARESINKFNSLQSINVTEKMGEKVFDGMRNLRAVSEDFIQKIEQEFDTTNRNAYSLVNIITSKAQDLDWEQRLYFERFAGSVILNMAA